MLTPAAALIGGNLFGLVYDFLHTNFCRDPSVKEWVEKHEQEQAAPVVAVGGVVDEEN